MTIEEARGWAAQAWTDDKNTHKQMDSELAESFAHILMRLVERAIRDECERVANALERAG